MPLQQTVVASADSDVDRNRDLAALSYAWIMAPLLLIVRRHSPFVHFHARQGTVLFVLSLIFLLIPYANRLLEIPVFLLMVWGFLEAGQGKRTELPIVGMLARGSFSLRGSWRQTVDGIVSGRHWIHALWNEHDHSPVGKAPPVAPSQQTSPPVRDIPPVDPRQQL
ncbi:hypothetical protein FJZ27_00850 [Candidatus Peribacteria bacterium]|nr:hypothetical protein [Candidatus Peribacteria bacterium]